MFDAGKFLREQFRDAHGVVGTLRAYKLPAPPHDTARKWFERGGVPTDWLPLLLCVLELENGQPTRLANYIVLEGDNA